MFSENLDDFLDTTYGLATSATLQGGATPIAGFFDAAYQDALGMAGTNPVFLCKASDVAEGDVDKTLTIAVVQYTIRDRQPVDDGAWVRLQLEAA